MTKDLLRGSSAFMPTESLHGLRKPFMPFFAPEGAEGSSGEGGSAGGDDLDEEIPEAPVRVRRAERLREPTTYEIALRREAARHRQRAEAAERALGEAKGAGAAEWQRKLDETKAAADAAVAAEKAERERVANEAKESREAAVRDATTAFQARVIRAEVRAMATEQGLLHVRGLDMLPLDQVKLDENGEVVVPEDFFAKAKEEFPFLFREAGKQTDDTAKTGDAPKPADTSSGNRPPKPKEPAHKKAADLTEDEWRAARAHILSTGRLPD